MIWSTVGKPWEGTEWADKRTVGKWGSYSQEAKRAKHWCSTLFLLREKLAHGMVLPNSEQAEGGNTFTDMLRVCLLEDSKCSWQWRKTTTKAICDDTQCPYTSYSEASPLGMMTQFPKRTRIAQQTLSSLTQEESSIHTSCMPIYSHTAGWWLPGLRSLQVAKATRIQSDAFPEAQGFWRQPARQAGLVTTVYLNISQTLGPN